MILVFARMEIDVELVIFNGKTSKTLYIDITLSFPRSVQIDDFSFIMTMAII